MNLKLDKIMDLIFKPGEITEVICVLDKSGSMGLVKKEAIEGFNQLLEEQKVRAGKTFLTVTLFNDDYEIVYHSVDINKIKQLLERDSHIKKIAAIYKKAPNFLYLGRGYNFPVALEGALKLKEISYIHAEGYPAAEMKHGPIALIDENMPVVVIATRHGHYKKVVSNIQEIKTRQGKIIGIVTEGDTTVKEIADYIIEVPETLEAFTPLLTTIPLQLLSYHIAVMRDCNVDQPRNLAKAVTVE